jgi:hypothetical protein
MRSSYFYFYHSYNLSRAYGVPGTELSIQEQYFTYCCKKNFRGLQISKLSLISKDSLIQLTSVLNTYYVSVLNINFKKQAGSTLV